MPPSQSPCLQSPRPTSPIEMITTTWTKALKYSKPNSKIKRTQSNAFLPRPSTIYVSATQVDASLKKASRAVSKWTSQSQNLKSASARTPPKRLLTRCKNEEADQPYQSTNKSEASHNWTCLTFPTYSWGWGITGRPSKRPSSPTYSQTAIDSRFKLRIACRQLKCR